MDRGGTKLDINWHEAHFSSISSQTTVYGFHKIRKQNNTDNFVVASIDSSFLSVEYKKVGDKVTPLCKNIQFVRLPVPGEAEIVSISAFERLPPKHGLVVGISYLVPQAQNPQPKSQVLNIYSTTLTDKEVEENKQLGGRNRLEIIADTCESLYLSYIPALLTHTQVEFTSGVPENVFLLSGNDNNVHVYREKPENDLVIEEVPCAKYFPEFEDLHTMVLRIEIMKPDPQHRLTAIGLDDGTVRLHLVNVYSKEMVNQWTHTFYTMVTSAHFFTAEKFVPLPSCLENLPDDVSQCSHTSQSSHTEEEMASSPISLLITSAAQPAVVVRDILKNGLSDFLWLPDSDKFDMPTCSLAIDIDFDGQNEVLIGTYGQELLVYKFFSTIEKLVPVSPYDLSDASTPSPKGTYAEGEMAATPPNHAVAPIQKLVFSSPAGSAAISMPPSQPVPAAASHQGLGAAAAANSASLTPGGGFRRLFSDTNFELAEEASKHRHKSDESNFSDKPPQPSRKVRSQDDLTGLVNEKAVGPEAASIMEDQPEEQPKMELRTLLEPNYRLIWQRSFNYPLMGLDFADMMGDGLENIVVLSLFGLHIMQPDMKELANLVTSRLQQLCMTRSEDADEFHKLQTE